MYSADQYNGNTLSIFHSAHTLYRWVNLNMTTLCNPTRLTISYLAIHPSDNVGYTLTKHPIVRPHPEAFKLGFNCADLKAFIFAVSAFLFSNIPIYTSICLGSAFPSVMNRCLGTYSRPGPDRASPHCMYMGRRWQCRAGGGTK